MLLMTDDFNVFKIHMMMMLVNMARKFGVMVEHQNSLFVLRNPRLQCSFGLAIVYKIALTAIHRKQKDGGGTFYHNTLRTKLSPLGTWKDMV